jgi:serine/threonine protein kinase/lipoprotein NlpI
MNDSTRNEALLREALTHIDQLLDKPREERATLLGALAHSRPELHALVMDLLEQEDSVMRGYMEPAAASPGQHGLQPDSRLGPYRIIRLIGEGGMGEVWLAGRDDGLYEGQVAIKTLHPYFAGGALRERFLREAKVLGRLAHTNIARLLDAGIHEGVVYLVLEYVQGRPIDVACDADKLDVDARLGIFIQLCAGVAHAHSSLVVHRDIKPGNVLLTNEGVPKLLDFGIANFYEPDAGGTPSDITRLTGRVFTPEYAAPEQILGQEITTATDVYSLGVLLYVLLAGKLPYEIAERDRARWEQLVLHQDPQRMGPGIDGDLENIVQKALEKRPEDRYLTVAAFADDIRRYLSGEPVLAQPDSAWYRLGKFARRNRLAVGAAAAVVCALGIGLAVSLWQLHVARTERQRAEESKDFIASIFRSADPFFTGKTTTSAVELLSLARRRIDQELSAQPENAIELLNIVGESQVNLEEYAAAKATFNKSIALAEALQPRDEVQIAVANSWLAAIARYEGDLAQVGPYLDKSLPVLRANQPRTGRALSMGLMEQGYIKLEEGDLDAAIVMAREAVDAAIGALGPAHTETLLARRHLGLFYVLAKRFDEAKPLAEEVLRDAEALTSSGERTAILMAAESLYGRFLHDSGGDPDETIRHYNNGIALGTEIYGPKGDALLPMLSVLKLAQSRKGDLKGMVATARRAYEITDGGLASSRLLTNLGQSSLLARQFPDAVEQLREAVELGKKFDTVRGSWLPIAQAEYAQALTRVGRFAEAERVLNEALPAAVESKTQGDLASTYNAIGLMRQFQGQWQESERAFRQALELTSSNGMAQKVRSEAILGIGVARLEVGDAAESEKHFREADAAAGRSFLAYIPLRADITMQLGRALLAQNKVDAARQSFATVDDYWRGYDAANRSAGEAAYWLGQSHLAADARPEARAALVRAIAILKDSPLPAHARFVAGARGDVARL